MPPKGLAVACAAALGAMAACDSKFRAAPAGVPLAGGGHSVTVRADWDDLDSAVLVGVGAAETAVLEWPEVSDNPRVYRLTTIHDEPGALTASGSPGPGPSEVRLEARLGRFGDAERERLLLGAIRRRLLQLAGVGAAPIR